MAGASLLLTTTDGTTWADRPVSVGGGAAVAANSQRFLASINQTTMARTLEKAS